mmetsp:Transcript_11166/g.25453  ORF Transcript_11166/g.25453 Transcript_11166/m.25453 type:complete len:256 (-) Transcript_11166:79-846(-)
MQGIRALCPCLPRAGAMASAGPVCLVVGVGPGIGGAVARKFAKEGYRVAVTSRTQQTVDDLAKEVGGRGYAYDASVPEQVTEAIAKVRSDFGAPIHTLIYNAGSGVFKAFDETSAEEFEKSWRINAHGLFLHAKAVCEEMKANGGVIAITGATASYRGMPFTSAFAPAKSAQRSLAQALCRDLGPKGVHVFLVIIDGIVDLPRTREMMPKKPDNEFLNPDAIADTYFAVATQPSSCWTFEINVIPGSVMGTMATV